MLIIDVDKCSGTYKNEEMQTYNADNSLDSERSSSPSAFNKLVIDLDRCSERVTSVNESAPQIEDNEDACSLSGDASSSHCKTPVPSDDDDDEGIYSWDTDAPSSQLTVTNAPESSDFGPSSPLDVTHSYHDLLYSEDFECDQESHGNLLKEDEESKFDDQSELYDDLLSKEHLEQTERAKDLQEKHQFLLVQNKTLTERVEKMTADLLTAQKRNGILIANISSLYQTARLELERKDKEIDTLRRDLDSFIFRRNVPSNFTMLRNKRPNVPSFQPKTQDISTRSYNFRRNGLNRENVQPHKDISRTADSKGSHEGSKLKDVVNSDFQRLKNYFRSKPKVNISSLPACSKTISSSGLDKSALSKTGHITTASSHQPSLTPDDVRMANANTGTILQERNVNPTTAKPTAKDSESVSRPNIQVLMKTPPDKKVQGSLPRKSPRICENLFSETANSLQYNKLKATPKEKQSLALRTSPRKKPNCVSKIKDIDVQRKLFKSENEGLPQAKTPEPLEQTKFKYSLENKHSPALRTSPRKNTNNVFKTNDMDVQHELFKYESQESPYKKVHETLGKTTPKKNIKKSSEERDAGIKQASLKSGHQGSPHKKIHETLGKTTPKKNIKKSSEDRYAGINRASLKSGHHGSPHKKIHETLGKSTPKKDIQKSSEERDTDIKHALKSEHPGSPHKIFQETSGKTTPKKNIKKRSEVQDADMNHESQKSEHQGSPHQKMNEKVNTLPMKNAKKSSEVRDADINHASQKSARNPLFQKQVPGCRTSPRKRNNGNPAERAMACRVSPRKKANRTSKMQNSDVEWKKFESVNKESPHKKMPRIGSRTTPRKKTNTNSSVHDKAITRKAVDRATSRLSPRKRSSDHFGGHEVNAHRRLFRNEPDTSPQRKRAKYSFKEIEMKDKQKKPNPENSFGRAKSHLSSVKNEEPTHTSSRLKLLLKYKNQSSCGKDDYYASRKISMMRRSSVARSVSISRKKDDKTRSEAKKKENQINNSSKERHSDYLKLDDKNKRRNEHEKTKRPSKDLPCREHSDQSGDKMCVGTKSRNSVKRELSHSHEEKPNNRTVLTVGHRDSRSLTSVSFTETKHKSSSVDYDIDLEDGEILSD